MRPFEANCYVAGWDACVVGARRSENPYRRPFGSAWDSYRASEPGDMLTRESLAYERHDIAAAFDDEVARLLSAVETILLGF